MRRRERARRDLSPDELLREVAWWEAEHPKPGLVPFDEPGNEARSVAWNDQWRAHLHGLGVDTVEYFRLRHRRTMGRLRWWAVQESREWTGVDVPVWAPPAWDDGVFPTRPRAYGDTKR